MGIFDFWKAPDINQGVSEYRTTSGAILLDVRTPGEFRRGHIEGFTNIPLDELRERLGELD